MSGIIYHAFDTTNGKAWIGQTWNTLEERRRDHFSKRSHCVVFRNALLKRPDAFVWSVLLSGLEAQEDMDKAEDAFILELNTLHPNGYNLKRGGRGGKHSEETKRKMSEKQKGRKMGPSPLRGRKMPLEHRMKIAVGNTGQVFSDERRRKIGDARRGRALSREHKRAISASSQHRQPISEETRQKMSEARRKFWEKKRACLVSH